MNSVYNHIKELIPFKTFIKSRSDKEFLIVMSEKFEIQYLNEVAKDFYELIDGNKSLEVLIEEMIEIYDVEKEVLEEDIFHLVRDLQWENLISLKEYSVDN